MNDPANGFDALASRLVQRASQLAEAWAQDRALARRADPVRWRRPGLLWPLFTKG